MELELSTYQDDIISYYENNPHANLMIRALAGSGKTFLAQQLLSKSKTNDVYIAFNTSIAKEFGEKITNPKVKVKTIHALAYSIMNYNVGLENGEAKGSSSKGKGGIGKRRTDSEEKEKGKVVLDNLKIYKILDALVYKYGYSRKWDFEEQLYYKENYYNLYNLCRLVCIDTNNIDHVRRLIHDYGIFVDYTGTFEKPSEQSIMRFIKDMKDMDWEEFENEHRIDFTDMLYITYHRLNAREWKVPFYYYFTNIIADEAQDFNNLQLRFFRFIKRKEGRYVFILDENQAIYHFSGANANSFKVIPKIYAPMKEFDLPINYRCPTSHLQRVVEEYGIPIKPRQNAPKGSIKTIDKSDILLRVEVGDMVIARKNKWLSSVVLDLVSHGVPVYMQDKDMVNELKNIAQKFKGDSVFAFRSQISKKITTLSQRLMENAGEDDNNMNSADSRKLDLYNFLLPIIDYYLSQHQRTGMPNFKAYLGKLLNESNPAECVRICSVHKAKGLEADNVFVLNEGKVCFDMRNTTEQNQQEKNLGYISITRARQNLYLVRETEDSAEKR